MCLSQLVRITEIHPDGATATGVADGVATTVSLAVLALDGTPPAPGDWVVTHTGLAVEKITDTEAERIAEARSDLGESG